AAPAAAPATAAFITVRLVIEAGPGIPVSVAPRSSCPDVSCRPVPIEGSLLPVELFCTCKRVRSFGPTPALAGDQTSTPPFDVGDSIGQSDRHGFGVRSR